MSPQNTYTDSIRQAQETGTDAVKALTGDFQSAYRQWTTQFGIVDPSAAVDQVFDFWETSLQVQRDFVKKLASTGASLTDTFRSQVESAGDAVRSQVESANDAVREQVEATQQAAREQALAKYDDLNKVELQDELATRDLPKTGNVDELRERLVADDQQ
jgi:predicted phage tail protein